VRVQDYLSCCSRVLFTPLTEFLREYEATLVIRGQRVSEPMKGPVRSGDVVDGVEYLMPLEQWSEAEVFEFLESRGVVVPAFYSEVAHSLDCWSCTAFLDQSLDKLDYLKRRHPEKWTVVAERLSALEYAIDEELQSIKRAVALVRSP
jgi:phosphoadenosine phosphosulfate reductase